MLLATLAVIPKEGLSRVPQAMLAIRWDPIVRLAYQ